MKRSKPSMVKVEVSEMPRLIPAGSVIELEDIPFQALRYGDVIYVSRPDRAVLCRFLRLWRSNDDHIMMLALPGIHEALAIPSKNLLGRVSRVLNGARISAPNNESILMRIWPRLTDYGTAEWVRRIFY